MGVKTFEISAYFLNLIFTKNASNLKIRRYIFSPDSSSINTSTDTNTDSLSKLCYGG